MFSHSLDPSLLQQLQSAAACISGGIDHSGSPACKKHQHQSIDLTILHVHTNSKFGVLSMLKGWASFAPSRSQFHLKPSCMYGNVSDLHVKTRLVVFTSNVKFQVMAERLHESYERLILKGEDVDERKVVEGVRTEKTTSHVSGNRSGNEFVTDVVGSSRRVGQIVPKGSGKGGSGSKGGGDVAQCCDTANPVVTVSRTSSYVEIVVVDHKAHIGTVGEGCSKGGSGVNLAEALANLAVLEAENKDKDKMIMTM
ncbi:hypothetical protein LOK49_LG12G00557 [Camellia lanceoleosa]|uniref:Uncharacterized protein n=1 Tax=Camellia lanceoleosa TaxID=1840588 RepID=A0ACC0FSP7_9ERIC|nr:hypothetical protein LOK49_LG12G00557 [Camellia lanceoleosa]